MKWYELDSRVLAEKIENRIKNSPRRTRIIMNTNIVIICSVCGELPIERLKKDMCERCYSKDYYWKHREQQIARMAEYRTANSSAMKQRRLDWYYANRQHATAVSQAWKIRNEPRIRDYESTHEEQRRSYVETRRARLLDQDGGFTASNWMEKISLYDNCCAYCGIRVEHLEQDHIIPLSKGGLHSWDNVVPACITCNRKKGNRLLFKKPEIKARNK